MKQIYIIYKREGLLVLLNIFGVKSPRSAGNKSGSRPFYSKQKTGFLGGKKGRPDTPVYFRK